MKRLIFAIFAHPDDEAFGPAGTLLTEARSGTEVHLISLTAGEAGLNPDNLPDIKSARLKEWRQAGQLIGAKDMHYLGYPDSGINNTIMIEATQKIIDIVSGTCADISKPYEIEFMTMDVNGISGHIDHIAAARAACLAFYRLKDTGLPVSRIRLACLGRDELPTHNTDWLYMEPGRSQEEIDEIIDARGHYETILKIMRCHHTQRGDSEQHIKRRGQKLGIDHFMVLD